MRKTRLLFVSWKCNTFWKKSRRWSPAAPVAVIQGMTNTNPVSDHETVIINSSFSEWLLWVIVFTYTAIDIVKDIMTGICVVIAIIGTFVKEIKIYLSIKWTMTWWTKYAGVVNPLVSFLDIRNQWPFANHRPLPRLSCRLLGQQPAITGRPRGPSFHLIDLSLSYYCCKYSNR